MEKVAESYRVVFRGWQERVGDLPWRPAGYLTSRTVPSPLRVVHVVERLKRLGSRPERVRNFGTRVELEAMRQMEFVVQGLARLLRLPPLDRQQETLARQGVAQAYVLLAGLMRLGPSAPSRLGRAWTGVWGWLHEHAMLVGPGAHGELVFRADLGGLPILSALFGTSKGWLRPCKRRPHLFVPMRADAFRQRICDECRKDRPSSDYATDLPSHVRPVWTRASHRMRMRIRYEHRTHPNQARTIYQEWRTETLADLRQRLRARRPGQSSRAVAKEWEDHWVPSRPRGRSRKETQREVTP